VCGWGSNEVLATDISKLANYVQTVEANTNTRLVSSWTMNEKGWHAWPIVLYYLGEGKLERLKGIKGICAWINDVKTFANEGAA
jgi:hypothetical protein